MGRRQIHQLPALASELARQQVAVIVATGGGSAALAAKGTTATTPIVFVVGFDPVVAGLVVSLNQPAGNMTGVTLMSPLLGQNRGRLRVNSVGSIWARHSRHVRYTSNSVQTLAPQRNAVQCHKRS